MHTRQELNETLTALVERSAAIEDDVKDLDHQIERALHAVAAADDNVGHAMGVLTERRNVQLGHMFELGKIAAQIEDLENRIQELDEQQQERQAVQEWETGAPAAHEDHLDWLRPALDRRTPEQSQDLPHHQREAEERLLDQTQCVGREPDRYKIG
ncbi:conserved hypothetical protein [Agrobacterium fabacearum CFBP 5771]|uniref:hypothetical protein n=1 Tax=Agrobacterium tumefaciens TaxID=358 RepID=UPI0009BAC121|nr:hypothetical protein [Agrobacterium tumefaciens]CVI17409.1 conserved hypothetical protein [Agrobacterium fabacearum CFBP 5771]